MREKKFEFELYRLNIVDDYGLFDKHFKLLRQDNDILNILRNAVVPKFDQISEGRGKKYRWCLRHYNEYDLSDIGIGVIASLTLARSIVLQSGPIVTESGIIEGVSESDPPLADTVELFFFMKRHLVAVERTTSILNNSLWLKEIKAILSKVSNFLEYGSLIVLEPYPEHYELIDTFKSFSLLTRIRVHLRLPNPELNRFTQILYDDLVSGGIRDYIQDMKNLNGLNKEEKARPFTSIAMAQGGYKSGEVIFEGIKDGKFVKMRTGNDAARGKIDQLKDFVRGLRANARSKEAQNVLNAISDEINRIAPIDSEEGGAT